MNQKPMCLPACSDRIQIRLLFPFFLFVPFLCYYGCALVHLARVSISVLLYGGLDCRLGGGLFVNLAFLAFPLQTGGINCVVVENNNKNRSSSKKSSAVGSVQQNTEPLFPSQQHPAVVAGCPAGCGFPTFGKNNHSVDVGRPCVCVCFFCNYDTLCSIYFPSCLPAPRLNGALRSGRNCTTVQRIPLP